MTNDWENACLIRDPSFAQTTLEPVNNTQEQAKFLRIQSTRKIEHHLFDRTQGSAPTTTLGYAQRLSGGLNERYGLGRSLSVMPGDKISAEVYAKYVDPVVDNRDQGLKDLIAQIAQLITTGSTASGMVIDGASFSNSTSSFPFPTEAALVTQNSTEAGPKAFLNWLVFDKDYNFILAKSGYDRLSTAPRETGTDVAHEKLFSPEITIDEPGFVYIYLSNEEGTPLEVYFDDFKVTQVKSPVIQAEDYYPFGLTFNSYSRENSTPNFYQYNGKEKQDELDLGWLDYGARMFDPVTARWMAVDPAAELMKQYSPYVYSFDNPVRFIDKDGMIPEQVITEQ